tara:strand:- start:172 stop:366 length:195 start_codon:yes stop_codon:yes gene_type:complete
MNEYTFTVPCCYSYTIQAKSEEEARKILVKDGGINLSGELCGCQSEDYKDAELVEEVELEDVNN